MTGAVKKDLAHEREEKYSIPRKRISCECRVDRRGARQGRRSAIRNEHRSTNHFTRGCSAQTVCPKSRGFNTSALFALFALFAFVALVALVARVPFLRFVSG